MTEILPGLDDFAQLQVLALLALSGLLLLARRRSERPWWRRPATWLLLVLAILSTMNYVRRGQVMASRGVLGYDVFHY